MPKKNISKRKHLFKQFQTVQLKCKSLKEMFEDELVELKEGQRGVVLDVLLVPNVPIGYNVEFFDETGETIAISSLEEKYLAPATKTRQKTKV